MGAGDLIEGHHWGTKLSFPSAFDLSHRSQRATLSVLENAASHGVGTHP